MNARGRKPGTVRIIGGEWRGRRLPVPEIEGLRPSGDRCRETLFNWLQPHIQGARAVDLFAGSGVLGFEAVSRGAAGVTLVEQSHAAAAALRDSAAALAAERVRIVEAEALSWLAGQPPASMDLVFVDPPFGAGLAAATLELLAHSAALPPGGLVYLESARGGEAPALPPGWRALREQVLGEVRMQLLRKG
jgi:16S rRNA (guanine966-N2)-methyltransferase